MKKIYIAYGSNLNIGQMARRCPNAKLLGKTLLKDWQLTFKYYATIEPSKGLNTPVGAWEIEKQCEEALDRYEGYPKLYRKEEVEIELKNKKQKAMVYLMNNGEPKMPSQGYVETIWEGYDDFGLVHSHLEDAMKDTMKRVIQQKIMKGTHFCKYCGQVAEGEYEDLLCKECRETFGHSLYSEL